MTTMLRFLAVFWAGFAMLANGQERTWTSDDGKQTVGKMLREEGDTEVLKKRRCKTMLFSFPGGHQIGPPDVLAEAMRWVEETSR